MEEKVKAILDYFEQINAIPRCSKNEEKIGLWLEQWSETKGLAVKKDAAGAVIELTSFAQTCSDCHTGQEELMALVNEYEEGVVAALEALRDVLADSGYYFQPSHPYFFKIEGSSSSADAVKDWTVGVSSNGKNNMGAAFNYNLIYHDPGAHVHNLQYTRKLIYDSIDFMDDGNLNFSVEATLGSGTAFDFLAGTR